MKLLKTYIRFLYSEAISYDEDSSILFQLSTLRQHAFFCFGFIFHSDHVGLILLAVEPKKRTVLKRIKAGRYETAQTPEAVTEVQIFCIL